MKSLIQALTETNIKDITTKGFNAFINEYSDVYDKSLYVVFSNTPYAEFRSSNMKPFPDAMVAFPVHYVVRNKEKFIKLDSRYITLIRLSDTANSIKINEITMPEVKQVYLQNGYDEDKFNELYHRTKLTTSMNVPSKMLLDIIRTKKLYNKLHYIYDTSKILSKSILHNEYASIVFIMKRNTYTHVTHYLNQQDSEKKLEDKSMRKLAAYVSQAMNTNLSNDKEVKMFMDYIFWTVDGIEIKITKIRSNESSSDHDGTYFVIEANTPNGMLLHMTDAKDTFEQITKTVTEKYNALATPNSLWEPQSRDLFLTGERYDYKNFDTERQRFVDSVEKYYPVMREFGRRYKIELPRLEKFTELDKAIIYHIVDEFIRKQDNPLIVIEELIENNVSVRTFIGLPATHEIDMDLIKKIAMIYVAAKKLNPVKSGWHIFENI